MSDHCWLTEAQIERLKPYFPRSHGVPRLDDRRVISGKGYDANWFRDGQIGRGITPCIQPKKNRKLKHRFDKMPYKQRHKVKNMFGHLKIWRRIATRYNRCARTFFATICTAATVIWWLQ